MPACSSVPGHLARYHLVSSSRLFAPMHEKPTFRMSTVLRIHPLRLLVPVVAGILLLVTFLHNPHTPSHSGHASSSSTSLSKTVADSSIASSSSSLTTTSSASTAVSAASLDSPSSSADTSPGNSASTHSASHATADVPAAQGKFCAGAPCVFDIGHNSGQDTADYLSSGPLGTRVVAVDANPSLTQRSTTRFAQAIHDGRLRLVTAGLVQVRETGRNDNLTFWRNVRNDKFSSFDEKLGCRDAWGHRRDEQTPYKFCEKISVRTRTCQDLVEEFGTPTYMKIDIEGMDMVCLRSLEGLTISKRPKFVSIENVWKEGVAYLKGLGYTDFKIVDQLNVSLGRPAEMEGASGPWGENAVDFARGFSWSSQKDIVQRLPTIPYRVLMNGVNRTIWYDLHARRGI